MMNDRLSVNDVAYANLLATKLPCASMASSNTAYQRAMEIQEIAFR
jgi:hypothetical protein